jgi:hypothetical protein
MKLSLASLLVLPALVLAQTKSASVQFTQPTAGTLWRAGDEVVIMWTSKNDPPTANSFNIELVYGATNSVQSAGVLVKAPAEKDLQVRIKVPDNIPTGNIYALRAGSNYSPSFTIENAKVPAGSSIPPLTPQQPIGGSTSGAERLGATLFGGAMCAVALRFI